MRVLSVVSEVFPLIKTGGLADVAGALPGALAAHGIEMTTVVPGYRAVLDRMGDRARLVGAFDVLGFSVRVVSFEHPTLRTVLVLDCPQLYDRDGGPYSDTSGVDFPDNWQRFGVLAKAAERIATGACGVAYEVVHAHDWQAGLVPAYLKLNGDRVGSVFTIHNIAFQGKFEMKHFADLALPDHARGLHGLEYYGEMSYLKAGLNYADAITTVSPTYAREILTPEFGLGMEGLINARRNVLRGIVNGLDTQAWDPASDPHLPSVYTANTLERRKASRAALIERFGLATEPDGPILGIVTRLTHQKGMDVVLAALPGIAARGMRLVVLGSGERELENGFRHFASVYAGHVDVMIGYDEALSHLIHAGSDALLVPSRFEPCGLTQLSALRYGAIPVVSRTGGLADTIIDANHAGLMAKVANGIQFDDITPTALLDALDRLAALFSERAGFAAMQKRAMDTAVGWDHSAVHYAQLYREIASS